MRPCPQSQPQPQRPAPLHVLSHRINASPHHRITPRRKLNEMSTERLDSGLTVDVADLDPAAAAARLVEIDARLAELTAQIAAPAGGPPATEGK